MGFRQHIDLLKTTQFAKKKNSSFGLQNPPCSHLYFYIKTLYFYSFIIYFMKQYFLIFLLFTWTANSMYACDTILCQNCMNSDRICQTCFYNFTSESELSLPANGNICPCPQGFFLSQPQSLCMYCNINCLACVNETTCITCVEGFMLLSNGICTPKNSTSMGISDLTTSDLQASKPIIYSYVFLNLSMTNSIENYIYKCDISKDSYIGMQYMYSNGIILKSVFNLAPHEWTRIRLQFIAFDDNWDGHKLILSYDLNSNYNQSFIINEKQAQYFEMNNSRLTKSFCGDPNYADAIGIFDISLNHLSSMIKIRVTSDVKETTYDQFKWGIRNLFIFSGPCYFSCSKCSSGEQNGCLECIPGYTLTSDKKCICSDTVNSINGICLPYCNQDQRGVPNNGVCQFCTSLIPYCERCTNSSWCIQCQSGTYLSAGKCFFECPSQYYPQIKTKLCKDCPSFCWKCTPFQCTYCNQSYYLYKGQCYDACPDFTYPVQSPNQCKNCSQNCLTCSSKTNCTVCRSDLGFTFTLTNGKCMFPCSGNPLNPNCNITCSPKCNTCFNKSDNSCSSCKSPYYLYQYSCLDSCPSYTYSKSFFCYNCHPLCLTCKGPGFIDCLSCASDRVFYQGSCFNNCPSGTYMNGEVCSLCPSNCATCVNQNECTSCATGNVLVNNLCYPACPIKTYLLIQSSKCLPCADGCLSCYKDLCYSCDSNGNYPYLDNGICRTRCSVYKYYNQTSKKCSWKNPLCQQYNSDGSCATCRYFLPTLLNTNSSCSLSCPQGYFINRTSITCSACAANCKTCFTPSAGDCRSCKDGYYLFSYQCLESCPNLTASTQDRVCVNCSVGCLTCNAAGECFTCKQGLKLYNLQCVSSCIFTNGINTYFNGSACVTCPNNCSTCISSTTCVRCSADVPYLTVFSNSSKCYASCQQKFYPDNNTMICQPCSSLCTKCTSPINCLQCTTPPNGFNLYLYNGICYSNCPNGTFGDEKFKTCSLCSSNCLRCYGPQADQCILCQPGYKMNINKCVQECPLYKYVDLSYQCDKCYPLCKRCYGPASFQCLNCSEGFYFYQDSCIKNCPSGTFATIDQFNNTNCVNCQEGCHTCDSLSCSNCKSSYVRYNSQCLPTCPQTTYLDQSTNLCKNCTSQCLQCTSDGCTLCVSPYVIIDGFCNSDCGPRKYSDGYKCQNCPPSCINCTSPSHCNSCQIGYILFNNVCLPKCPNGYYNSSFTCTPCQGTNCTSCYDSTHCTSCAQGYFLTTSLQCKPQCPNGYYNLQGSCYKCSPECSSCTNSWSCASCPTGLVLSNGQCINPKPNCLYSNSANCSNCSSNCLSCISGTQCNQCSQPYYLLPNLSCAENCPQGYFGLGSSCQQCNLLCETCVGQYNNCTKCRFGSILLNGKCILQCPSGFFLNQLSNQCQSCQSNCRYCFNQSYCNDCLLLNFKSECVDNCPLGTFMKQSRCVDCPGNCSICINQTSCSYCDNTTLYAYNYNGKCIQQCPANTFLRNSICIPCSSECSTCTNSTSCIDCKAGFFKNINNQCKAVCPVGTYIKFDKCSPCSNGCLVCSNSTSCQKCNPPLFLFNSHCTQSCPQSALLIDNQCFNCPSNCINCLSQSNCLQCVEPYTLWGGKCVSTCPISYYMDSFQSKCLPCNSTCLNCTGNTLTSCKACIQGYYLNNGACVQNCPVGTYPTSSQICTPCPAGCQICSSPTSCTKCKNSSYTLTNGQCNNGTSCTNPCATCSSATSCTSCIADFYLIGSSCVSVCPNGYFIQNQNCQACTPPCLTCSSQIECTSCISGFVYSSGKCSLVCPPGTIPVNNECVSYNCSDLGNCQNCTSNQYLYKGKCYTNCPSGTSPSGAFCIDCPSDCLSCNSTNCISCTPGYHLIAGKCYKNCPSGTYPSGSSCNSCVPYCSICADSSSCNQCVSGTLKYLDKCYISCPNKTVISSTATSCIPCPSNCVDCTPQLKCKTCDVGYYLNPNSQTCVQACPSGYYPSSTSCQICPQPCKQCSNSSICISCIDGYQLVSNSCIKCSSGTYFSQITRKCTNCPSNCSLCVSSDSCATCNPGYLLYQGNCISTCPNGYFKYNSESCQQCPVICTKCSSINNCTSCIQGYTLDSYGNCIQIICGTGQYLTSNNSCANCSAICKNCFGPGPTQCTTCKYPYVLNDGICIQNCPSGTFASNTGQCLPCVPTCLECLSLTECKSCLSPLILYRSACILVCPAGTFASFGSCLPCSSSCGTCVGSASNCQSCNGTLVYYNGQCYFTCPQNTYLKQGKCLPCSSNCAVCDTAGCSTCLSPYYLNPATNQCTNACPTQTYQLNGKCLPCSSGCILCSSPISCTICDPNFVMWNGVCWNNCPTGYQPIQAGSVKTCVPSPKCYLFFNNFCVDKCPIGYYNNTGLCAVCPNGCLSCSSNTSCNECLSGFSLINGVCNSSCPSKFYPDPIFKQCLPCTTSCLTCTSQSSCTSCVSPYVLNPLSKSCDTVCPMKYFMSSQTCMPCAPQCLTCSDSTQCTSCLNPYNNITNNCNSQCGQGNYTTNGGCAPCSSSCKTCFAGGNSSCSSCPSMKFLYNGQCIATCPQGYYNDTSDANTYRCSKCQPECINCSNSNSCYNCQAGYYYYKGNCFTVCPSGSFVSQGACIDCPTNCSSCVNESQCTSCKQSFYLYNGQCYPNCPENNIPNSARQCVPCTSPCLTCSNQASKCTSCITNYILVDNICYPYDPCTAGTVLNGSTCSPCPSSCMKCKPTGSCEICLSPYFLSNGSCVNSCPTNTSFNQYTYTCSNCTSGCKNCVFTSASDTRCYQCSSGYYLYQNGCVSTCPAYYYNQSGKCLPCGQIGCRKCLTDSICFQCQTGYAKVAISCVIICPKNTFPVSSSECKQCSAAFTNCQECTSLQCTLCQSPYVLFNQQCLNSCPSGYANVNNICQKCRDGCTSCKNLTSCEACLPNLISVGFGGCVSPSGCANGTYYSTTTGQCQSCDLNCRTCYGPNYFECTGCKVGQTLINSQCQDKCSNGTYFAADGSCAPCIPPCQTCQNSSSCTSCAAPLILQDGKCLTDCSNGYYKLNGECFKCPTGCLLCTSASNCSSCQPGYLSYLSQCYMTCPKGTFKVGTTCQKCPSTCEDCSSSSNCSKCVFGYYLVNNSCVQDCPAGSFSSIINNVLVCSNCTNPLCKTCLDKTNCNSCVVGAYLFKQDCVNTCPQKTYQEQNVCIDCKIQCKTCTNITNCTSCLTNFTLVSGKCISDCGEGLFWNGTNCANCNITLPTCLSCLNTTTCIKCNANYKLQNGKCVANCGDGTYLNTLNNTCMNCSKNCKTCTNQSCQVCKDNYILMNGACIESCPPKTVNVSNTCKNCPSNCVICNTNLSCTKCVDRYMVSSGECVTTCPDGTYQVNGSCSKCSQNCKVCINSTFCSTCKPGYVLQNNACVSTCNSSSFFNPTTNQCQDCPNGCSKCSSSTNCTQCQPSFYYYNSQCYSTCPSATYLNSASNSCTPCNQNCLDCTSSQCTRCKSSYLIYKDECVKYCPDHTYLDNSGGVCKDCPKQCQSCTNSTQCTSCISPYTLVNGYCTNPSCPEHCLQCDNNTSCKMCSYPFLVYDESCIDFCPDSFYSNGTHCQPCMQNCLICPNSTYCQQCYNGYGYLENTTQCAPDGFIEYGKLGNMSTFTSNITATISAVYLSSSAGPLIFGQMSSTYFNLQFTQMLYFHSQASGDNPQVSNFLNSLSLMSFQLPFSSSDTNSAKAKRLLMEVEPDSISQTFLLANKSILVLMLIFLGIYISVLLTQKYMNSCFDRCPKIKMYAHQICEFLLNRFTWNYFDFMIWLSYMPFLFFSISQLKKIGFNTADMAISSLISILIIVSYPLYPGLIYYLIRKHYSSLEQEGKNRMIQMSMAPYVYGIKRDKINILYYPVKYIRKLLFVIFAAAISDPVASLGCLIALNVVFVVLICVRRPHSMLILMILDLIIEGVLLFFEIFMLVYVKNSASLVSTMSIITHGLGFLSANLSLVIAIILNLIAYYKIIKCIYELVQHLRQKGIQHQSNKNVVQQDEKFAKQMQQIQDADMGTQIGDNLPPDLLQEKFNRLELFNQQGIDPSHNNGGDFLWDEKGLIGFSQSLQGSKQIIDMNNSEEGSQVGLMDIIHDQDGKVPSKKDKYKELDLGVNKKKSKNKDKQKIKQKQKKNVQKSPKKPNISQQAQIMLQQRLGKKVEESKSPSKIKHLPDQDPEQALFNRLGNVTSAKPIKQSFETNLRNVVDEELDFTESSDVFKKQKKNKNNIDSGQELASFDEISPPLNNIKKKRISRQGRRNKLKTNQPEVELQQYKKIETKNGFNPLEQRSSEEKLRSPQGVKDLKTKQNGTRNLPPLPSKNTKVQNSVGDVPEFQMDDRNNKNKETKVQQKKSNNFFEDDLEEPYKVQSNKYNSSNSKNSTFNISAKKEDCVFDQVGQYEVKTNKNQINPKVIPQKNQLKSSIDQFFIPEALFAPGKQLFDYTGQLNNSEKIKITSTQDVPQYHLDQKKTAKLKGNNLPSLKKINQQDIEEAQMIQTSSNKPLNKYLTSFGGNGTIPEVTEQSIEDYGISSSKIKVPPRLHRFDVEEEMWKDEEVPAKLKPQKLNKTMDITKPKDKGFIKEDDEFQEQPNPIYQQRKSQRGNQQALNLNIGGFEQEEFQQQDQISRRNLTRSNPSEILKKRASMLSKLQKQEQQEYAGEVIRNLRQSFKEDNHKLLKASSLSINEGDGEFTESYNSGRLKGLKKSQSLSVRRRPGKSNLTIEQKHEDELQQVQL